MPIKLRPTDILISVLIEGLLVFVSMVPYGGGVNPWTAFATPYAAMLGATIVLFVILQFLLKWDSFILHFVAAIIVFVIGVILGLPIVLSFITAMLLLWRLTDALNGNTLNHLWIIYAAGIFITFLYIVFLGVLNMDFPHLSWFIIFFFIETLLVVLLHFFQVAKNGQFGKKMTSSYTITFGVIILIAVIFAGIGPFISKILRLILEGVGMAVFYVVQFFWSLLMSIRSNDSEEIMKGLTQGKKKPKDPNQLQDLAAQTPHHYTIAGIIFVVIVGLIIFFYLKRKWDRDGKRKVRQDLHREAFKGEFKRSIGMAGRKAKIKAPKDPVRLELFQLQKRLLDQKEGRIGHETLGEWLGRLPAKGGEFSIIRSIYEKVRYGKKPIRGEELTQFQQAMMTVKEHIKKQEKKKTNLWEK